MELHDRGKQERSEPLNCKFTECYGELAVVGLKVPQPQEDFYAPRWRGDAAATDGDCPSPARVPERTLHQSQKGASDQELDLAPQLVSNAQGTKHHSQTPSWVQSCHPPCACFAIFALESSSPTEKCYK